MPRYLRNTFFYVRVLYTMRKLSLTWESSKMNVLSVYFETKPNSIFQISTALILTIQAFCVARSTVSNVSKDCSIFMLFMNRTTFVLKSDTAL